MDWPVCNLQVNKRPKFDINFYIRHQLEHFKYEMNWTFIRKFFYLAFILCDISLKESYFIVLEYSFTLLYRSSDNSTRKSKSKLRNGKLASTDEFFKNDLRKMIEMMNYSVIYCSMTQIFNLFFLH